MTYQPGTSANAIEIALSQVGVVEEPDNKVIYNNMNGLPWCGYFVDWVLKEAGVKGTPSQIGTVAGAHKMKDIGRWVTDKPLVGDLCYMGVDNAILHIGIVGKVTANWVLNIEGNTSGKGSQDNGGMVMVKKRFMNPKKGEFGVIGFSRPKYVPYKGEFPEVSEPVEVTGAKPKKGILKK